MVSRLGGLSDSWVSFMTPPWRKEEAELYFLGRASKGPSQMVLVIKNVPANAGDIKDRGAISGQEDPLGGGNGNSLQYSYLVNPTDRGTWRAVVHVVKKSQTRLKWLSTHMGHPKNGFASDAKLAAWTFINQWVHCWFDPNLLNPSRSHPPGWEKRGLPSYHWSPFYIGVLSSIWHQVDFCQLRLKYKWKWNKKKFPKTDKMKGQNHFVIISCFIFMMKGRSYPS